MAESTGVGHGVPPAPQPQGQTETPAPQQAEGNISLLDYAKRKLRERDQGASEAEGSAPGDTQKPPSPPKAAPEPKSVLSQAAEPAIEAQESAPASEAEGQAQEETAAADTEASPAAEEDAEGEDALPDNAPEWMQKRMARFTRQKHELQRQLEEATAAQSSLRAELDQLKVADPQQGKTPAEPALPVVIARDDPAGHLTTEAQIDQVYDQARETRRWCMRHPNGGVFQVPDGKGGVTEREFTPDEVTTLREATEDDIEKHLPRRRQFIRNERAAIAEAVRRHPWLKDEKSPRVALMSEVIKGYPEIRLRPDWVNHTAIYARGLEVVQREWSEAEKALTPPRPKPGVPPVKIPGPSPSAPSKKGPVGVANAELAAAEKAYLADPSADNFARRSRARRKLEQTS
jgi:hypothetical protein